MNEDDPEALDRTLQAERQKLTEEQRLQHDLFCRSLTEAGTFTDDHAVAGARVIRTEHGVHQNSELRAIEQHADADARDRAERERLATERQNKHLERKAEERRIEQERAAEQLNLEKLELAEKGREAKSAAARLEPTPNATQRLNLALAEAKSQRAKANEASVERAADLSRSRPDYARYDSLKPDSSPRAGGEVTDAKAERLRRMFEMPNPDTGFDASDQRPNARGPRGGGRGSR